MTAGGPLKRLPHRCAILQQFEGTLSPRSKVPMLLELRAGSLPPVNSIRKHVRPTKFIGLYIRLASQA
jgi:hypothetical protein